MSYERSTIADAITAIRLDLEEAAERDPAFRLVNLELELGLVLEDESTGSAGIKWFVEAGLKESQKLATSHVVRIRLEPGENLERLGRSEPTTD